MSFQEPPSWTAFLRKHDVKQRSDCEGGGYCGLLVRNEFAIRFVDGPEHCRKVVEIRSKAISCLQIGDRIGLLSTEPGQPRKILAILQFEGSFKILDSSFDLLYDLHHVTAREYQSFKATWARPESDHCFGWKFKLVHIFLERPVITAFCGVGAQVWAYFFPPSAQSGSSTPLKRKATDDLGEHELLSISKTRSLGSDSSALKRKVTDSVTPCSTAKVSRTSTSATIVESLPPDVGEELEEDSEMVVSNMSEESMCLCLLLDSTEWQALASQKVSWILRPYRGRESRFTVLIRTREGHEAVGIIEVGQVCDADLKDKAKVQEWAQVYSTAQLSCMKANKHAWAWCLSEVMPFSDPHRVKFLDLAPRYKNRPFTLSASKLKAVAVSHTPEKPHLQDTAKFFLAQLSESNLEQCLRTVQGLHQKVIRIGTTCSGTDICVHVLKETVGTLCKLKAGHFTLLYIMYMYT